MSDPILILARSPTTVEKTVVGNPESSDCTDVLLFLLLPILVLL